MGRDSLECSARRKAEQRIARLESELARASRVTVLGEMATSFAHELNQPLAAISNYAAGCRRLLQRGAQPAATLLPTLLRIEEEAHRAGAIISGIRDFIGRNDSEMNEFDLLAVVTELPRFMAAAAIEHGDDIEIEADSEGPCPVSGNPVHIQQVLVNLILNAFEAMRDAGSVKRLVVVRLARTATGVEVRVEDSGPGLSPEDRHRVFDAFYSTKPEGMGMGLAICRTLVERHGGKLWADDAPGGGAAFVFTLPAASPPSDEQHVAAMASV